MVKLCAWRAAMSVQIPRMWIGYVLLQQWVVDADATGGGKEAAFEADGC